MSATTELLLENIKALEAELAACVDAENAEKLKTKLTELRRQFTTSSDALNEAKTLLKG